LRGGNLEVGTKCKCIFESSTGKALYLPDMIRDLIFPAEVCLKIREHKIDD